MSSRRTRLVATFVSILLVAACGDKAGDKTKADPKADAKTKADVKAEVKSDAKAEDSKDAQDDAAEAGGADVLALGDAKIMEKGKPDKAVELKADGTVIMEGKPFFKIGTDGKLTSPDGAAIGNVGADGSVTMGGQPLGATLTETGATLTRPDGKTATFSFAEDGALVVDPKPEGDKAPEMIAEGCKGPVAKTCALVMLTFLLRSEPVADDGPQAVEVPPVEPERGPEAQPPG